MTRIVYRLDEATLLAQLGEMRRLYLERTAQGGYMVLIAIASFVVFGYFGFLLARAGAMALLWGIPAFLLLNIAAIKVRDRLWVRRLMVESGRDDEREIVLGEEALSLRSPRTSAELKWESVTRVYERRGNVFIALDEATILVIPGAALADHGGCRGLLEQLNAHLPHRPAPPDPQRPTHRAVTLAAALHAGARAAFFADVERRQFKPSGLQIGALGAVTIATKLASDFAAARFDGFPSYAGLFGQLGFLTSLVVAAWLVGLAGSQRRMGIRAAWLALAIAPTIILCENVVRLAFGMSADYYEGAFTRRYQLGLAAGIWLMVAVAVQTARWSGMRARTAAGLGAAVLLGLLVRAGSPYSFDVWMPHFVEHDTESSSERAELVSRWKAPASEAVLYSEAQRLDQALERIGAQTPGAIDMYWLAVAGWGSQNVFKKETARFAEQLGAGDHGLELVNNPETAGKQPFATLTSIRRAIERLGKVMDPTEDVFFLYATSHGSAENGFSLSMHPYDLDDLTPAKLKEMLDAAAIRWRVLVISSCYSGTFVPALADENTIVLTAAAADRRSFGCSNDAELTYFGRALLEESARPGVGLVQAFEAARETVKKRELAEKLEPSNPQLHVGAAIAEHIARRERERKVAVTR